MSKIDQRTQYESGIMSMFLIMIGLVITVFYVIIYTDFATWYKVVVVINAMAGVVFMWSFLVTQYQQYLSYMDAKDFQEMKGGNNKYA